jgi:hypothetical protein
MTLLMNRTTGGDPVFMELELEIEEPMTEDKDEDEEREDDRGVCVIDFSSNSNSIIEDILGSK